MKNKKRNNYFIVMGILLLVYLVFNVVLPRDRETQLQVYKPSVVNDCANYSNNVNEAIDFTKNLKNEKMVEDNDVFNFEDYEQSSCVKLDGLVLKDYITLKDHPIIHQKGQNNQAYQLSYATLYDEIKKIKDPNDMDKKMMNALEYLIRNPYEQSEIDDQSQTFKYYELTGPKADDPSGTYYPIVDLKILENKIYKKDKDELKLVDTKYILDDIMVHYDMEGQ